VTTRMKLTTALLPNNKNTFKLLSKQKIVLFKSNKRPKTIKIQGSKKVLACQHSFPRSLCLSSIPDIFRGSLRRQFCHFPPDAVSQRRRSAQALFTLASPSAGSQYVHTIVWRVSIHWHYHLVWWKVPTLAGG
jgi:hypothetical protein